MRLSIVIEWANTRLNGVSRAWQLLDILSQQWQQIVSCDYPETLPEEAFGFLDQLDPRAQLLIVSGEAEFEEFRKEVTRYAGKGFDVEVHFAEGLEYYPLKSFGAQQADGALLLFVDSDVLPDERWLAHLLGTLARSDIHVAYGQTYVAPTNLYSRAFALGWTYELRDEHGRLDRHRKLYANNIVFRMETFRKCGFPALGRRTRGACTLLREKLAHQGIAVWQNSNAAVDHPPPTDFRHLVVRALAHGRDHYMKRSEKRHLTGLFRSVGTAMARLTRGYYAMLRDARRVGLELWQLPGVIAVLGSYYGFFALGGFLTHISPNEMAGRYRV